MVPFWRRFGAVQLMLTGPFTVVTMAPVDAEDAEELARLVVVDVLAVVLCADEVCDDAELLAPPDTVEGLATLVSAILNQLRLNPPVIALMLK